jgi:nucleotide-binding universal stress UspA family protein
MTKLLACIDGSRYADLVCTYAASLAKPLGVSVDLLHVLRRNSEYLAPSDLSGSIGLGARSTLLEELTKVDESRGKLDQEKGRLILDHGREVLSAAGVAAPGILHRRGALVETIGELEGAYDILFLGKRGEHADPGSRYLGSNLEKVARAVTRPLFIAPMEYRPIKRFLIAYDGKNSTRKAVRFFAERPALNHLECHLLSIGEANMSDFEASETELQQAGYSVIAVRQKGDSVEKGVTEYVEARQVDWLAIGAYSHSPLRNLLLGSTTASLILSCKIPMILFR